MRFPRTLVVLLAVSSPVLAATPIETVSQFHAALAAGKSDQAKALLDPGVQIYESGYVERSRDEYANHHLAADMKFAKATTRKVLKQAERIESGLAVVMQETETTGKFEGKPVHLLGTETTQLEKRGEEWVIVHMHWSSRKSR